jgi:beta-fructofuranosidase
LELQVVIEPGEARTVDLTIGRSDNSQKGVAIHYDGQNLEVAGTQVPFTLSETEKQLKLHLFLDRSVLEVFANDGRVCVTRVIDTLAQDTSIELFATGGRARFESVKVWEMNSIW